jgi:hypothetical protein
LIFKSIRTSLALLILFLALFINQAQATEQDSVYVISMKHKVALRLYNIVKTTDFSLYNQVEQKTFKFSPNNGIGFGIGFSYKWMALDMGFIMPGTWRYTGKDDTKFDFIGTIYGKKHVLDITAQYYEGYYLRNPDDFFPPINERPINSLRTDIGSVDLAVSYLYVLNHSKYSFQSSFMGDMIQKKSAGSFTFHGFVSLYNVWADTALVRYDFDNSLNEQALTNQIAVLGTGTGLGYAHTFVLPKKFFITLSAAPILMLSASNTQISFPATSDINDTRFNFRFFTRNAIGYNSNRFYLMLNLSYDNFRINLSNNTILNYSPTKLKLFFGYRLAAKKGKMPLDIPLTLP